MKILAAMVPFLIGCASGHCRNQGKIQPNSNERIRVYKYDGSLQCGMGEKIPVEIMVKELGDIKVYSSVNRPDGLMHIQMCNSPTGSANIYEINKDDLEKAIKLGFKEWTFDHY